MESMSISQHSQPNEAVSPAMGEVYELLQWMPKEANRRFNLLPTDQSSLYGKVILFDTSQMSTCIYSTFSLGLVPRDILTGIAETGRGKQTLLEKQETN